VEPHDAGGKDQEKTVGKIAELRVTDPNLMPKNQYDLLLIDDDREILRQLEQIAQENGWSFLSLKDGRAALEVLDRTRFKAVIMELALPGFSGLQILEWIRTLSASPEVIIITGKGTVESAVQALKLGAFDYLIKPFETTDRVKFCIRQALEKHRLLGKLQSFQESGSTEGFESIIGMSPKIKAVFEMIRNVAGSDSTVLIQGESGTGKELIAKAIHRNGPRQKGPFVVINSAALPDTLLESELFGYTKGSFTGAATDKMGLFEAASGGTVFLDEIGDIPLSTQVKLLRVLQEGEIRPVGATESRHVDVRVVTATNKDLAKLVREGKFREDLYYRLNVIAIHLPTLRERTEDIPILAYHFLKTISARMGKEVTKISVDALQAMQNYGWPGNIRELENIIERAIVLANGDGISAKNLPSKILSDSFYAPPESEEDLSQLNYKEAKKRALNIFNRSYIISLLKRTNGNITAASEKAGMDRSNFKKVIRKYRIEAKA
ncbi:MAG: sigma-54 dependent transcriptional regulator, partial [Deltaproteobacteria bacterium]|nr:sigma-54 dependent transcriptional regulator [Deltaproteobacteria bacterium]